jgi:RNA polymerase sigma-70 factor (ECF subfamily)
LERELVESARRGDRVAFDALVRQKVDAVYRTALAILGREADAEDAAQEAFVAAWRALPTLRVPDRFDAWLGRITLNACRMALRRRRAIREIGIEAVARQQPDRSARGRDPGDTSVDVESFDRAFERLSIDERAILVLHHRDGMGLPEVALRLGVPVGTVKSRLHRARRALERSLERERPR